MPSARQPRFSFPSRGLVLFICITLISLLLSHFALRCCGVAFSVGMVSFLLLRHFRHFRKASCTSSPSMTSSPRRIFPAQSSAIPSHLAFCIVRHRSYFSRGFSRFAGFIRPSPCIPLIIRNGMPSFFLRIRRSFFALLRISAISIPARRATLSFLRLLAIPPSGEYVDLSTIAALISTSHLISTKHVDEIPQGYFNLSISQPCFARALRILLLFIIPESVCIFLFSHFPA